MNTVLALAVDRRRWRRDGEWRLDVRHEAVRPLRSRSRRGMRGYPLATVAFYGPNDQRATKVAVGILLAEDTDVDSLERFFSERMDVRSDMAVMRQVIAYIKEHGAKSVVLDERVLGCPHEEGIDYPQGAACPQCPFWAGRDRWTGELTS